mgnify:FL=1
MYGTAHNGHRRNEPAPPEGPRSPTSSRIGLRPHAAPIPPIRHLPPSPMGVDATLRLVALSPLRSQIALDLLHLSQKPKRRLVATRGPQNPSAQRTTAIEPSADDGLRAEPIPAMRANRRRHPRRREVRKDRLGNLPFAGRPALSRFFRHCAHHLLTTRQDDSRRASRLREYHLRGRGAFRQKNRSEGRQKPPPDPRPRLRDRIFPQKEPGRKTGNASRGKARPMKRSPPPATHPGKGRGSL